MKTDESLIGAWLGIAYVVAVLVGWVPIDMWLRRHHHEYITTEAREVLQSGGWRGVIFCFLVAGVVGVGLYHFFWQRQP